MLLGSGDVGLTESQGSEAAGIAGGVAGIVPMVVEQAGRRERSFDIYSRLLREHIVFLGQEVNDDIANLIAAQLLHLDAQDPGRDISLYVNSPGGSAYAG